MIEGYASIGATKGIFTSPDPAQPLQVADYGCWVFVLSTGDEMQWNVLLRLDGWNFKTTHPLGLSLG
ncbi:hypothetical protein EMIT0P253_10189 [Pseudomonas sp. IT-P253]